MRFAIIFLAVVAVGCAPSTSGRESANDEQVDAATCTPTVGAEDMCADKSDNDCDGLIDCGDPDCSGIDNCECGKARHPEGPLALPDGEGGLYFSKVRFDGFPEGKTVQGETDLLYVCAKMEHSYLRDLQMELVCPSGAWVVLNHYIGRDNAREVLLGVPNEDDEGDGTPPVPGIGENYCWTPTALKPSMVVYAEMADIRGEMLPPDNYRPAQWFEGLIGCELNGNWSLRVQDLWASDNGFIFEWSIGFEPTLLERCDDPVIQ
jgi:subtilisin-like proprotein convertase family protein